MKKNNKNSSDASELKYVNAYDTSDFSTDITNKIVSSLKGKSNIEKIKDFLVKLFINKCTITYEISNLHAIKYLYNLDRGTYYKSVDIKTKSILKEIILYNSGKRNFTVTRYKGITKPAFYKLGHKAYLYVSPVEVSNNKNIIPRLRLIFTGRNVLPFIMDFVKYLNNERRGSGNFTYNFNTKDFRSVSDNAMFYDNDFIISDELKDRIMNYINNSIIFSKNCFEKHGVIKNPGIILYGLPGTGKTTLIKLISYKLQADVYSIRVNNIDEELENLIDDNPVFSSKHPAIICFEDIDVIYNTRESLEGDEKNSFNTLLQFLDGYKSIPNIIKIATTNHIERLDSALTRPGRFDLQIEMKNLNEELARKMCNNYGLSFDDIVTEKKESYNPAELQAKIIENINYKVD